MPSRLSLSVSACLDITTPSDSGDFPAQQDFAIALINTVNDEVSSAEFGAQAFGSAVTRISTAPDLFATADATTGDIQDAVVNGGRFRTTNSAILSCTRFLTRQAMNERLVMVTVTDGPTFRNIPLANEVAQARENNIALVGVTVGDNGAPDVGEFSDDCLGFSVGSFFDLSNVGQTVGQSILNAIAGGAGEDPPMEDPPQEEPPVDSGEIADIRAEISDFEDFIASLNRRRRRRINRGRGTRGIDRRIASAEAQLAQLQDELDDLLNPGP